MSSVFLRLHSYSTIWVNTNLQTNCGPACSYPICALRIFVFLETYRMTPRALTDIGHNPEEAFPMRISGTLVNSGLKQKNKKGLHHVWCHLLLVSCHPNVNTKAPERTASNSSYAVNLQTRMAGIHWQIAVTEQRTLQWTNPFEHSAFCRERQPAKTGHWSYIAIVPFFNTTLLYFSKPTMNNSILPFWKYYRRISLR